MSDSEKQTLQDFDLSIFILLDAGEDDKQSWLLVEDSRNKYKYRVTIEKIEEQDVSSK